MPAVEDRLFVAVFWAAVLALAVLVSWRLRREEAESEEREPRAPWLWWVVGGVLVAWVLFSVFGWP